MLQLPKGRGAHLLIYRPVIHVLIFGITGEGGVSDECRKQHLDNVGLRAFESGEESVVVRAA